VASIIVNPKKLIFRARIARIFVNARKTFPKCGVWMKRFLPNLGIGAYESIEVIFYLLESITVISSIKYWELMST